MPTARNSSAISCPEEQVRTTFFIASSQEHDPVLVSATGKVRGEMVSEVIWRDLGACRGLDPEVFFPETDDEADVAKNICDGCDVRVACLEHALASREKVGVWGGTTERERRRIVRQRRRTA